MTTDNDVAENEQPDPELAVEKPSSRPLRQNRRFEPGIIKRARILWACGVFASDSKLQEFLGIKGARVIHQWRQNAQPDGYDWYAFREEWGSVAGPKLDILGPDSELEMRQRILQQASTVAAHAMAALKQTAYFDQEENRVTHLWQYDAAGDLVRVKLQALGPTTFGQVSTALKQAAEVQDKQVEAMGELQRTMADREAEHIKIASELGRRLADGGEPLTDEQRRILVTVEREVRGEEETAPEPGALTEGVSEEEEDLDEMDDPEDDLDEG